MAKKSLGDAILEWWRVLRRAVEKPHLIPVRQHAPGCKSKSMDELCLPGCETVENLWLRVVAELDEEN